VIRDSAGVRIVEPTASSWTDADRWTLDPEFIQIGVVEGDTAREFSYLEDGAINGDGTVALLDRQSREVRVFSATGEHRITFGRKGNGPGEFRGAGVAPEMTLTFASSDTVIVTDGRRLSWFMLDGSLLREVNVRSAIRNPKLANSYAWIPAADGSLLMVGSLPMGPNAGQNWVYLAREVGGELSFTSIADYHLEPGVPVEGQPGTPRSLLERPFTPTGPAAAAKANPLRVFVGDPQRWEIRVHEADGAIESIIRLPVPRSAVTAKWIAAARESLKNRRKDHPLLAELLGAFDELSHPDSMPGIRRIYWDEAGYLWVEHYTPSFAFATVERRVEVLRPSGEWLGQIVLPHGVGVILSVNSGHVLTSHADADGVHYARIHTVVMPTRK
jgi:hypothetical protein